jgi:four helix bundle protein
VATAFEDLRVLQTAETIADAIWKEVVKWDELARDVVGKQMARAADSMGANIAEGFGRFHYGDKLQFLYYARGSLFETKYWLNRVLERNLMPPNTVKDYASQLTDLARQLNAFANSLKFQRSDVRQSEKVLREASAEYVVNVAEDEALFSEFDLEWLQTIPTL